MKPEEALDNINNKILIQGRRNGKYLESEMMKVIIEALEKQVVKPIIYRIEPLGKKRHELFYECPNCNVDLPKIIKSDYLPKYCPLCGQAIDWGNRE